MSSLGPQTHLEGKPQSFVELADVVLEVDGAQFLAHRAILAAQSRVLSELLVEVAGAQGGGANSGAAGERARPVVVVGVGRPGREGSSNGESEGSACMHLVNTSHEWAIDMEKFSSTPANVKLHSPVFELGGYPWQLKCYPRGFNKVGQTSLFLRVPTTDELPHGWQRSASFSLAMVNHADPAKNLVREIPRHTFTQNQKDWGFPAFASTADATDPARGFCVGGTVTLRVQMSGPRPSTTSADAFAEFLKLVYNPFVIFKEGLEGGLARLVVPCAHYLQADEVLRACDAAIASSLAISFESPAPYVEQPHGLGADTDALDLAIRYDLPRTAAKSLGSVLAKLAGRQGKYHGKAVQYADTLPAKWQSLVMREMVHHAHASQYAYEEGAADALVRQVMGDC